MAGKPKRFKKKTVTTVTTQKAAKPKRTYRKRNYKAKSQSVSRGGFVSIVRTAPSPIPLKKMKTFHYQTNYRMTTSTAASEYTTWLSMKLNHPYDPDLDNSGRNASADYWDLFFANATAGKYTQYVVLGCYVTAEASLTNDGEDAVIGVVASKNTKSSPIDYKYYTNSQLQNLPNQLTHRLINENASGVRSSHKFKFYAPIHKVLNVNSKVMSDGSQYTAWNGTPTNLAYLHLWAGMVRDNVNTVALAINWKIDMRFRVLMLNPILE